jgi:tetratricopeptide (TPR) repeat protein
MIETERGSVMVISAESGMGKTALARTFAVLNASRVSFYFGQSDDLIAARTLGPVRDILNAAGLALPGAPSPDQVNEQLDKLVSRSKPTVVVMEDLHWADDGTLDALRHLYQRLDTRRCRTMLLMTFRPEDVREGHPLRRLLASLRGKLVDRIELQPLTIEGIVSLSGRSLSDARDLERLTGGNPLFVTEVIESGDRSVPASVRDAVLGRFDRLSDGSQKLIRFMSVVPTRVERWLLDGIVNAPADSLIEAERQGIIVGDGNFAWFRHELVRRAIEESLPTTERSEWNRVVLRGLLERGSDVSRIVHHAAMAEDADVLIHWAPQAADAAISAGSYRQAVDHLRLVLRHADRLDMSERARLLGELSHTLYLINRFEEANRHARSAVEIFQTQNDPTALAASLINLSRTAFWASGPLEARTAGQRALEAVASTDDVEMRALAHAMLARAHSNLATLGVVAEPSALALEHAQAALDLAERLDRDDLRTHALNYRGTARLALGDVEGATDLERSVALASKQPQIEYVMRAYVNASGGAYRAGRFDQAIKYIEEARRTSEGEGEFFAGEYRIDLTEAAVLASKGEWSRAVTLLTSLWERPGEPGIMRPLAGLLLGRLLARRGEDRGAECVEEAARLAADAEDIHLVGPLAAAQIEIEWLVGRRAVPPLAEAALRSAVETGHTTTYGEVVRYLQRIGARETPHHPLLSVPEPWASGLMGDVARSAEQWKKLGERYEAAVETALDDDPAVAADGRAELESLGAHATVLAIAR